MKDNVLQKVSHRISVDRQIEDVGQLISTALQEVGNIYSFIVYEKYTDDKLSHWIIDYSISQSEEYNTLSPERVSARVTKILTDRKLQKDKRNVIGYEQPSIDLMVKLFEPLVKKLVSEQLKRWKYLEYDDLYQMCMLDMVKLHKLNYYLHPTLLRRAFNNSVLMHIRKNKNAPMTISLYDTSPNNKDGDNIKVQDTVPDYRAEYKMERIVEMDAELKETEDKRNVIIDLIGQRQYDQLVREYGNGMTTTQSRHAVFRLKEKLHKQGINSKMFYIHHESLKGGK